VCHRGGVCSIRGGLERRRVMGGSVGGHGVSEEVFVGDSRRGPSRRDLRGRGSWSLHRRSRLSRRRRGRLNGLNGLNRRRSRLNRLNNLRGIHLNGLRRLRLSRSRLNGCRLNGCRLNRLNGQGLNGCWRCRWSRLNRLRGRGLLRLNRRRRRGLRWLSGWRRGGRFWRPRGGSLGGPEFGKDYPARDALVALRLSESTLGTLHDRHDSPSCRVISVWPQDTPRGRAHHFSGHTAVV